MNTSLDPLEHNSKPKNLSYCTCKYIRDNTHLMIIKAFIHIHIQILLKINTINEKIIISDNFNHVLRLKKHHKVVLLASSFECIVKIKNENYRLDPCNCISSPGFSWNKMFNTNNVTFFSDFVMDFFLFVYCT